MTWELLAVTIGGGFMVGFLFGRVRNRLEEIQWYKMGFTEAARQIQEQLQQSLIPAQGMTLEQLAEAMQGTKESLDKDTDNNTTVGFDLHNSTKN